MQAPVQRRRLFRKEGVFAAGIDDVVEDLVLVIVAIRIFALQRSLADFVGSHELLVIGD